MDQASGGGAGLVLPVPSSSRPGQASLELVPGLADLAESTLGTRASWSTPVLRRSRGEIGHMRPNVGAFVVPPELVPSIVGSRILLLDDIYVSGSRAQSAASVLRRSGARSVLIVPLGRAVRPDRCVGHASFAELARLENGHHARCVVVQAGAGRR
jgi:hypothetical protein